MRNSVPARRKTGTRVALCFGSILFLIMLTLQILATLWLASGVDNLTKNDTAFERFADSLTRAGYGHQSPTQTDPLLAARSIVVTTPLNEKVTHEVISRLILMDQRDSDRPIHFYLSTPGGSTNEVFAIIDAMQTIRAPVNTYALGACFSGATAVLASGTGRRYAGPNAIISVHASLLPSTGPKSYFKYDQDRYEKVLDERASLPEEWFPMTTDRTYFLTAQDALELGLIDGILPEEQP